MRFYLPHAKFLLIQWMGSHTISEMDSRNNGFHVPHCVQFCTATMINVQTCTFKQGLQFQAHTV